MAERTILIDCPYLRVERYDAGRGMVVCAVSGEVDLGTAPRLEAALIESGLGAKRGLIADVSGVEFMTTAGLRTLIRVGDRLRAAGRWFGAVIGTGAARRVLDLTRQYGEIGGYPSVPEALGAIPDQGARPLWIGRGVSATARWLPG